MVTKSELVERARALAPLVAQEVESTDKMGAVPPHVIDAFCDAGFMKIFVPKKYGGYELSYDTMTEVVSEIAPICSSTAWILAFYIGHNYIHSLFPEKSQEEVFREKSFALTPGTAAPTFVLTPTKGGYIARGRSSWNSGSSRADWFSCGGVVKQPDAEPTARLFVVPAKEVQVISNWDVAGMRGTSSHDIIVEDVFIPEYNTVEAKRVLDGNSPGAALHPNPLYSVPLYPFIVGEVMPVIVGAYRGAVDEFVRITKDRVLTHTAAKVSTKQTAHIRIGKGLARVELAQNMLNDYVAILANPDVTNLRRIETRAAIRARCAAITEFCCDGINDLMLGSSASVYRNDSPMQRFFRDSNMLRVHAYLDPETGSEVLGRATLGLPAQCPI